MDNTDIYDLPLPSSVPVKGLSGVRMVKEKPQERVVEGRKNEVGIGELVMDGLGRREKRGELYYVMISMTQADFSYYGYVLGIRLYHQSIHNGSARIPLFSNQRQTQTIPFERNSPSSNT